MNLANEKPKRFSTNNEHNNLTALEDERYLLQSDCEALHKKETGTNISPQIRRIKVKTHHSQIRMSQDIDVSVGKTLDHI